MWNDPTPRPWKVKPPRNVAVLGELESCALHDPATQQFYGLDPEPGTILCASPDGRELYGLRPVGDAGPKRGIGYKALHAIDLHERFVQRKSDGYFNLKIAAFRKPTFRGELAIIRYIADKSGDAEVEGEAIYEHYFDEPGVEPAYAELWDMGLGQFYIPPGPWQVTDEGIVFLDTHKGVEQWPFADAVRSGITS